MLGNESGDMMLEQGLTRAQMAALLTRIVTDPEQFETDSAFYRSLCSFTDVPEWAKSYVGYCVANNLVAGYGNGRYGSNDPVTSAAACTVMLRCLNDVDAVWDYQSVCLPDCRSVGTCCGRNCCGRRDYPRKYGGADLPHVGKDWL